MNLSACLTERQDGVLLAVKVQPRASRNELGDVLGSELKIKITAPPVDSAANDALLRFLAEILDCPRSAVQLVRGQTARHKQVFIRGMNTKAVTAKLAGRG